jgi:hypothetical protein
MASLGLPHWLMIGGLLLMLAGFAGLMLTRNAEGEADPASPTSDIDETASPAVEETEEYESQAVTASRKPRLQERDRTSSDGGTRNVGPSFSRKADLFQEK